MVDSKHFQGYVNWESFTFSVNWSNDQGVYDDFIEKAAGGWSQHKGDHYEIGRILVDYAREHYTGAGEGANDWLFKDLETDEEWDAIDRAELGEEVCEAMKARGDYAYLMDEEGN